MVGGTVFHRDVIQREISRALVLNLSGKASGATALPRILLSLTAPSLLSRPTRRVLGLVDDTHPTAAQLLDDAVVRDILADH